MVRIKTRKLRENDTDGVIEVDGEKLDASQAVVVFEDEDKDIQVVASPDPDNENSVTVAVLTASEEAVEDEKVLSAISVEGGEGEGASEARKAARREAFRKRLEAKRKPNNAAPARNEARVEAFRKRLEARRANKPAESRKSGIAETRAKFRSKLGKRA